MNITNRPAVEIVKSNITFTDFVKLWAYCRTTHKLSASFDLIIAIIAENDHAD